AADVVAEGAQEEDYKPGPLLLLLPPSALHAPATAEQILHRDRQVLHALRNGERQHGIDAVAVIAGADLLSGFIVQRQNCIELRRAERRSRDFEHPLLSRLDSPVVAIHFPRLPDTARYRGVLHS